MHSLKAESRRWSPAQVRARIRVPAQLNVFGAVGLGEPVHDSTYRLDRKNLV
jgi:hypothetical protein